MPTGVLSTRVDAWLHTKLTGDATLTSLIAGRVYLDDTAPASYPHVRLQWLAGPEVLTANGTRVLNRAIYLVEAVGRTGNWGDVSGIADAIYAALHRASGTVTGGTVLSCICEEEMRRPFTAEGGTRYRYLGWRCRIEAVPT